MDSEIGLHVYVLDQNKTNRWIMSIEKALNYRHYTYLNTFVNKTKTANVVIYESKRDV